MPKIRVLYDNAPDIPEQGTMYLHCKKCLAEIPEGQSPAEWARQQMMLTEEGFQVWCTRHECNIAYICLEIAEDEEDAPERTH